MDKKTLRKEIATNGLAAVSAKVEKWVTKECARMRKELKKLRN